MKKPIPYGFQDASRRQGYESGFESLGFSKKTGNLVYGGVDIALSGYGLLRNTLKPEA
ncbi:DUF4225 domain-containing protein [Photorhabdus sp. P32]|uniref:DUF4225 domain-containing protein n=1 Tax=Photorhabdus sp. P32 TaxID=3117549 RepID=UPI00311AFF1D